MRYFNDDTLLYSLTTTSPLESFTIFIRTHALAHSWWSDPIGATARFYELLYSVARSVRGDSKSTAAVTLISVVVRCGGNNYYRFFRCCRPNDFGVFFASSVHRAKGRLVQPRNRFCCCGDTSSLLARKSNVTQRTSYTSFRSARRRSENEYSTINPWWPEIVFAGDVNDTAHNCTLLNDPAVTRKPINLLRPRVRDAHPFRIIILLCC